VLGVKLFLDILNTQQAHHDAYHKIKLFNIVTLSCLVVEQCLIS